VGVVTAPVGEGEPGREEGGFGNLAYWTEAPTSSGSSTSVRSCWESDVFDDERMGAGARDARFGFIVVGFVPERLRNVSGGVVTIEGDLVLL